MQLLQGGRVGFGSVSDTTDVNLCNEEGGLTFSSSSLGMTPQKVLSVSRLTAVHL